ncbi:unnamed protein product, partial [Mesorhabditis belari]|uniref:AMOP domain-containing protein n=1 Tax=Mesorhabditis belari TaxID=2138241 RepID=A0AAF3FP11_9BILA
MVPVDPTQMYKNSPKVLASQSGVPHMVRGRYMFRVDDVVRPGGCSNKTGGTFPMMIYPNIVNMLGETTVDVNAMCLDRAKSYILMIEQRQVATCLVLNPSIARCSLPKIFDWGTRTVYFQPRGGGGDDEKAFVGYIYFVPPTLDPQRLEIGSIYDWFKNPLPTIVMPISWYPRNFTNPDLNNRMDTGGARISDDSMYSVQLGLYVIGYKEFKDDNIKKFRPEHRIIARLGSYANKNQYEYRWRPQEERINLNQVEQWYMTDWERMNELYTYRFGYLKLAPIINLDQQRPTQLPAGLVSHPISLHWMWTTNNPEYQTTTYSQQEEQSRVDFVKKKAMQMCHDWYNEDGAQSNFIRDTETNASCPCVERQAMADLGRFMPHPRCSQTFRDITCTQSIGARNCYMSAQNVYGSYAGSGRTDTSHTTSRVPTHYGQVCCYDKEGFLMQTSYQPVIKVTPEVPYNPGFPLRAYEFGTSPYMGQWEVPGLSAFHNDYMPYFLCCKYSDFRCQMFYWRRPSSGCQEYQPPAYGEAMGAGIFNTIDNDKFIFNEPGVYTLLYIPKTLTTPEVRIQVRLERYPNRKVDFSYLGRWMPQKDLVQPSNATVITGIAIEATGTDRVHVLARKDTRRFRYRTSVIVGNILRYFDTMHIQRFTGVLVYVNSVERGQAEIYVVLEEAQIGVRIRESFNRDIDRLMNYQESFGMLNVALSVPPQYGVRPDGDKARENEIRQRYNLPKVSGLMRPFPEQTMSSQWQRDLQMQDVNSESYRQQIVQNYKIHGTGESGSDQNLNTQYNSDIPTDNMFTASKQEDSKFDVFPESAMRSGPIYKAAEEYEIGNNRFYPITGSVLIQILNHCRDMEQNPNYNLQPQASNVMVDYGISTCPNKPSEVIAECGDNWACLYNYALLNSKVIGEESYKSWNSHINLRNDAVRQYNSCGPINIEYPEYLMKVGSMDSAYLDGDVAQFECFQSHWTKGTHEYKCGMVANREAYRDSRVREQEPLNYQFGYYRFEWNKGDQPWCRSREKENFFIWLAAILGTVAIIIVLILIYLCCWCMKQKKREEKEREAAANGITPSRTPSLKKHPYSMEAEPLHPKIRPIDISDELRAPLTPHGGTPTKVPPRDCFHLVCIPDLLQHYQQGITAKKLLLECPVSDCKKEIHENDVEIVLDPFERSLDSLMSLSDRIDLLHQHQQQQIIEAFGGVEMTKACPICLNVYGERVGCHLVECANKRCQTRFCWDCGEITDSLQHFIYGKCRLGADDLDRRYLLYRWLNGGSRLGTFFFTPLLPLILVFVMPIWIAIYFPLVIYQRQIQKARFAEYDKLTKAETQFARFKAICLCIVGVPFGIILGFLSLFSSPFLFIAYTFLAMIVLVVGKVNRALKILGCLLRCLGLGDLHAMIEQTIIGEGELKRRKARRKEIERKQKHPDVAPSTATRSKRNKANESPIEKKPTKLADRKHQLFTPDKAI